MNFETNYPYLMVHGMMGFGEEDLLYRVVPYWGMLAGNVLPAMEDEGMKFLVPSIGKYTSAWDRACELWAYINGGTVDYGKAHSEKYGHARYGRTYAKAAYQQWSSENKINMVGHSFGGATMRLLASLMAYGSDEEKAVTPEDELSELFKGGKNDWIYSITAVACVHEGTTLLYSLKNFLSKLEDFTYVMGNLSGNNVLGWFYGGHLEQWDLTGFKNGKVVSRPMNKEQRKKLKESHDNVWYDLTMKGNKELNERIKFVPDIYYFSWPLYTTMAKPMNFKNTRVQYPRLRTCPLMWPFAISMGKYDKNTVDDYPIDERWLRNDGMVNTISETAPFSDPQEFMAEANGKYEKGKWYIYDPFKTDHLGICGGFLPPTKLPLQEIYQNHFRLINSLKK